MGVGFTKLRSQGHGFLVVNALDSAGEEGKNLAPGLCGETGSAGLGVVRHRGRGHFKIQCLEPDGSPLWPDSPLLGPLIACAAHEINRRYGASRPVLVWHNNAYTSVVRAGRVLLTPVPGEAPASGKRPAPGETPVPGEPTVPGEPGREYHIAFLFEAEAAWPLAG